MSKKIQAIRGMNDLLPSESSLWSALDETINNLMVSYGYKYCSTPIVESTETFSRAIGEVTILSRRRCTPGRTQVVIH